MTEVSTPPPMLPEDTDPTTRAPLDPAQPSRLVRRLVIAVVAIGALTGLILAVPSQTLGRIIPGHALIDEDTVAQKPGTARPTAGRVAVEGVAVDEPEGAILFTTVAVDSQVSIYDWLESEIDDDIFLRRRVDVFGDRSVEENRERNLQMMAASKDIAVIVALQYLGVAVVEETGVGFEAVVDGGPVDGLLAPGDIIVAIDGVEITGIASLLEALMLKAPGEPGVITVDNIDTLEVRDEEIEWGVNETHDGGFIGIENVVPRQVELDLPFDIAIDSGNIGGPSAGLAFTLTILDLLTVGDLTGGNNIAVTGTILGDGSVGNVGGVEQKAAAAHDAGAVAFIVPVDIVDEAESHASDMPVIGVASLDEALEVLADFGGETQNLELLEG